MRRYNESWVIEAYTDNNPHIGVYMRDRKRGTFTTDIMKACRFLSEHEARNTMEAYNVMVFRKFPQYNFRLVNVSLLSLKPNTAFQRTFHKQHEKHVGFFSMLMRMLKLRKS